eukprot:3635560-Pyramimonas_sp.AAC.1
MHACQNAFYRCVCLLPPAAISLSGLRPTASRQLLSLITVCGGLPIPANALAGGRNGAGCDSWRTCKAPGSLSPRSERALAKPARL